MLRPLSGLKGQYHYLTLVVVSEFNEWRVLVHGPGVTIQGARQFSEAKAKEHALEVARYYVHERKGDALPSLAEVEWTEAGPEDWLIWRT